MKQSRKARAASLRNLRKARAARRRRSHRPRRRGHRRNPVAAPAVTVARQPNRMRRKTRRKRKHNPATATPTPAARQPNRARRRTRRKRRSNPVTLQANAVRRSRRTGKFVKGRRSGRGRRRDRRNARRVGARRRNTHYKSVGGYRRKGSVKRHRRRVNPVGVGGLVRNQFSRARLMEYGAGVLGLGIGLTFADLVDRYVATMPPQDAPNPWYGRNAAAAYQRRPDVMRLGAQGLGALLSMVATYVTRNVKGAPWLFGGMAGGFGINLVQQGMRWWVMPMLLKSDDPNEVSWANRLYPLEQKVIQDPVAAFFDNLTAPTLQLAQSGAPTSTSPLAGGGSIYALGRQNQNGQRRLIPTGKLGACAQCGGEGGCYSDCPDYNCEGCGNGDAMYEMEHGDNMDQMTAEAGVSPGVVYGLNGGKTFFAAGERVRVPHALGRYLQRRDAQRGLAGTPEAAAPAPVVAPPIPDMSDHFGGNGFSGTSDAAMDLMNGYSDAAAE